MHAENSAKIYKTDLCKAGTKVLKANKCNVVKLKPGPLKVVNPNSMKINISPKCWLSWPIRHHLVFLED